jgi:hypothetical protein
MSRPTFREVAELLASEHMKDDPNMTVAYWVEHPTDVVLIEITSSAPQSSAVCPFRFAPDPPDVPYPSVLVLLHPADLKNWSSLEWPEAIDPVRNPFWIVGIQHGSQR